MSTTGRLRSVATYFWVYRPKGSEEEKAPPMTGELSRSFEDEGMQKPVEKSKAGRAHPMPGQKSFLPQKKTSDNKTRPMSQKY